MGIVEKVDRPTAEKWVDGGPPGCDGPWPAVSSQQQIDVGGDRVHAEAGELERRVVAAPVVAQRDEHSRLCVDRR